jgi:hypothetical protein
MLGDSMALPLNHPLAHPTKVDPVSSLEARVAKLEKIIALQADGSVNIRTPSGSGRISIRAGDVQIDGLISVRCKAGNNLEMQGGANVNCKAGSSLLIDGGVTVTTRAGANMQMSAGSSLDVKSMGILSLNGPAGVNVVSPKGTQTL